MTIPTGITLEILIQALLGNAVFFVSTIIVLIVLWFFTDKAIAEIDTYTWQQEKQVTSAHKWVNFSGTACTCVVIIVFSLKIIDDAVKLIS